MRKVAGYLTLTCMNLVPPRSYEQLGLSLSEELPGYLHLLEKGHAYAFDASVESLLCTSARTDEPDLAVHAFRHSKYVPVRPGSRSGLVDSELGIVRPNAPVCLTHRFQADMNAT